MKTSISETAFPYLYNQYRNRTVMVTGGHGFIGVNLVQHLLRAGAKVKVMDIAVLETLPPVMQDNAQLETIISDLRDQPAIMRAVDNVDVIFHLAGMSGPSISNQFPRKNLDINLNGLLILLEACRKVNPTVKLVFPSSRLVYAPNSELPVTENAATLPISIYGIHKLTSEHYLRLYSRLYGLRSNILRITNPYGSFQSAGQKTYGIINYFIQRAVADESVSVYGDGLQLRDYIHVNDTVRAMLACGVNDKVDGMTFNVGGGQGVPFIKMAKEIIDICGSGIVKHTEWPIDAKLSETGDFCADVSAIRDSIGWSPEISLSEGLRQVIASYKLLEKTKQKI